VRIELGCFAALAKMDLSLLKSLVPSFAARLALR
jgi:hypothetical protein